MVDISTGFEKVNGSIQVNFGDVDFGKDTDTTVDVIDVIANSSVDKNIGGINGNVTVDTNVDSTVDISTGFEKIDGTIVTNFGDVDGRSVDVGIGKDANATVDENGVTANSSVDINFGNSNGSENFGMNEDGFVDFNANVGGNRTSVDLNLENDKQDFGFDINEETINGSATVGTPEGRSFSFDLRKANESENIDAGLSENITNDADKSTGSVNTDQNGETLSLNFRNSNRTVNIDTNEVDDKSNSLDIDLGEVLESIDVNSSDSSADINIANSTIHLEIGNDEASPNSNTKEINGSSTNLAVDVGTNESSLDSNLEEVTGSNTGVGVNFNSFNETGAFGVKISAEKPGSAEESTRSVNDDKNVGTASFNFGILNATVDIKGDGSSGSIGIEETNKNISISSVDDNAGGVIGSVSINNDDISLDSTGEINISNTVGTTDDSSRAANESLDLNARTPKSGTVGGLDVNVNEVNQNSRSMNISLEEVKGLVDVSSVEGSSVDINIGKVNEAIEVKIGEASLDSNLRDVNGSLVVGISDGTLTDLKEINVTEVDIADEGTVIDIHTGKVSGSIDIDITEIDGNNNLINAGFGETNGSIDISTFNDITTDRFNSTLDVDIDGVSLDSNLSGVNESNIIGSADFWSKSSDRVGKSSIRLSDNVDEATGSIDEGTSKGNISLNFGKLNATADVDVKEAGHDGGSININLGGIQGNIDADSAHSGAVDVNTGKVNGAIDVDIDKASLDSNLNEINESITRSTDFNLEELNGTANAEVGTSNVIFHGDVNGDGVALNLGKLNETVDLDINEAERGSSSINLGEIDNVSSVNNAHVSAVEANGTVNISTNGSGFDVNIGDITDSIGASTSIDVDFGGVSATLDVDSSGKSDESENRTIKGIDGKIGVKRPESVNVRAGKGNELFDIREHDSGTIDVINIAKNNGITSVDITESEGTSLNIDLSEKNKYNFIESKDKEHGGSFSIKFEDIDHSADSRNRVTFGGSTSSKTVGAGETDGESVKISTGGVRKTSGVQIDESTTGPADFDLHEVKDKIGSSFDDSEVQGPDDFDGLNLKANVDGASEVLDSGKSDGKTAGINFNGTGGFSANFGSDAGLSSGAELEGSVGISVADDGESVNATLRKLDEDARVNVKESGKESTNISIGSSVIDSEDFNLDVVNGSGQLNGKSRGNGDQSAEKINGPSVVSFRSSIEEPTGNGALSANGTDGVNLGKVSSTTNLNKSGSVGGSSSFNFSASGHFGDFGAESLTTIGEKNNSGENGTESATINGSVSVSSKHQINSGSNSEDREARKHSFEESRTEDNQGFRFESAQSGSSSSKKVSETSGSYNENSVDGSGFLKIDIHGSESDVITNENDKDILVIETAGVDKGQNISGMEYFKEENKVVKIDDKKDSFNLNIDENTRGAFTVGVLGGDTELNINEDGQGKVRINGDGVQLANGKARVTVDVVGTDSDGKETLATKITGSGAHASGKFGLSINQIHTINNGNIDSRNVQYTTVNQENNNSINIHVGATSDAVKEFNEKDGAVNLGMTGSAGKETGTDAIKVTGIAAGGIMKLSHGDGTPVRGNQKHGVGSINVNVQNLNSVVIGSANNQGASVDAVLVSGDSEENRKVSIEERSGTVVKPDENRGSSGSIRYSGHVHIGGFLSSDDSGNSATGSRHETEEEDIELTGHPAYFDVENSTDGSAETLESKESIDVGYNQTELYNSTEGLNSTLFDLDDSFEVDLDNSTRNGTDDDILDIERELNESYAVSPEEEAALTSDESINEGASRGSRQILINNTVFHGTENSSAPHGDDSESNSPNVEKEVSSGVNENGIFSMIMRGLQRIGLVRSDKSPDTSVKVEVVSNETVHVGSRGGRNETDSSDEPGVGTNPKIIAWKVDLGKNQLNSESSTSGPLVSDSLSSDGVPPQNTTDDGSSEI